MRRRKISRKRAGLHRLKSFLAVISDAIREIRSSVCSFLMTHPAVNAASVVGLPDARLSEVAVAFMQRAAGHALSEQEVIEHCRGRVASFKIPRHVVFADEFPMTSSGKVQKVKLREWAQQEWA